MPQVILDVNRKPWQLNVHEGGEASRDMKHDRTLVRPFREEQAFLCVRGPGGFHGHGFELIPVCPHNGGSSSFLGQSAIMLPGSGALSKTAQLSRAADLLGAYSPNQVRSR